MRHATPACILAICLVSGACSREEAAPAPGATDSGAAAAPAIGAGSPPAPAGNRGHAYACSDGSTLNARVDKGKIVLGIDGQTLTLSPTPGASGARYSGEGISFLAQGEQAVFAREGQKPLTCTAK